MTIISQLVQKDLINLDGKGETKQELLKNLAETLVNLTVKDVNELAAILKDEYGIEPAAAAVVVAGGAAGEAAEEKTEFDVILKSAGANKLAVLN